MLCEVPGKGHYSWRRWHLNLVLKNFGSNLIGKMERKISLEMLQRKCSVYEFFQVIKSFGHLGNQLKNC